MKFRHPYLTLVRSVLLFLALGLVDIYSVSAQSAGPVPTVVTAGTAQNGTTTATVPWPASNLQAGDIGVLVCETANEAVTLTTPAGFTEVPGSPVGINTAAGTTATRLTVFWARSTGTTMTSPVTNDPGDHIYCRIFTVRGVRQTGNPWDVTPTTSTKAVADTTSTNPSITTTSDNNLILLLASRENDATTAAWSGWTSTGGGVTSLAEVTSPAMDSGTTSGNGGGFVLAKATKASAGATNTVTATVTSTVNTNMTLAFVPTQIYTSAAGQSTTFTATASDVRSPGVSASVGVSADCQACVVNNYSMTGPTVTFDASATKSTSAAAVEVPKAAGQSTTFTASGAATTIRTQAVGHTTTFTATAAAVHTYNRAGASSVQFTTSTTLKWDRVRPGAASFTTTATASVTKVLNKSASSTVTFTASADKSADIHVTYPRDGAAGWTTTATVATSVTRIVNRSGTAGWTTTASVTVRQLRYSNVGQSTTYTATSAFKVTRAKGSSSSVTFTASAGQSVTSGPKTVSRDIPISITCTTGACVTYPVPMSATTATFTAGATKSVIRQSSASSTVTFTSSSSFVVTRKYSPASTWTTTASVTVTKVRKFNASDSITFTASAGRSTSQGAQTYNRGGSSSITFASSAIYTVDKGASSTFTCTASAGACMFHSYPLTGINVQFTTAASKTVIKVRSNSITFGATAAQSLAPGGGTTIGRSVNSSIQCTATAKNCVTTPYTMSATSITIGATATVRQGRSVNINQSLQITATSVKCKSFSMPAIQLQMTASAAVKVTRNIAVAQSLLQVTSVATKAVDTFTGGRIYLEDAPPQTITLIANANQSIGHNSVPFDQLSINTSASTSVIRRVNVSQSLQMIIAAKECFKSPIPGTQWITTASASAVVTHNFQGTASNSIQISSTAAKSVVVFTGGNTYLRDGASSITFNSSATRQRSVPILRSESVTLTAQALVNVVRQVRINQSLSVTTGVKKEINRVAQSSVRFSTQIGYAVMSGATTFNRAGSATLPIQATASEVSIHRATANSTWTTTATAQISVTRVRSAISFLQITSSTSARAGVHEMVNVVRFSSTASIQVVRTVSATSSLQVSSSVIVNPGKIKTAASSIQITPSASYSAIRTINVNIDQSIAWTAATTKVVDKITSESLAITSIGSETRQFSKSVTSSFQVTSTLSKSVDTKIQTNLRYDASVSISVLSINNPTVYNNLNVLASASVRTQMYSSITSTLSLSSSAVARKLVVKSATASFFVATTPLLKFNRRAYINQSLGILTNVHMGSPSDKLLLDTINFNISIKAVVVRGRTKFMLVESY